MRQERLLAALLGVAVCTALSVSLGPGCGGGGGGPAAQVVGAGGGTVLSTADRNVSLVFPAGVLGHDTAASIEPIPNTATSLAIDTSGAPAYQLHLQGTSSRGARLRRATGDQPVLLHALLPTGFDATRLAAFGLHPNASGPILLDVSFDPTAREITVYIPTALLHSRLDSSAEAPGDFDATPSLTVGLGQTVALRDQRRDRRQPGLYAQRIWDRPRQPVVPAYGCRRTADGRRHLPCVHDPDRR